MVPCGKGHPAPCMSDHGALEKRAGQTARVPLFHTPTMCPATDTSQVYREDLPVGLNPCAQFLHISDTLTLPLALATTFYSCKEETTESTSLPSSLVFL